MNISANMVVTISFKLFDSSNQLLEESPEPIVYLHGTHSGIFPKIEEAWLLVAWWAGSSLLSSPLTLRPTSDLLLATRHPRHPSSFHAVLVSLLRRSVRG